MAKITVSYSQRQYVLQLLLKHYMNNFIYSILNLVKDNSSFITNNSKQNKSSEYGKRGLYYDFSPIDVCEDEDKSSYEEEFNQIKYALENEKVKNLAILGKFGTGKSSLISSFFKHAHINNKKISEKEYVTVSLADFDYLKENTSNNIEDDRSDNLKSGKSNTSDSPDKEGSDPSSENSVDSSSKSNQSSSESVYQNLDAVEKEIIRQLSYGKLSKNIPVSFLSKFKDDFWDNIIISIYLSPILIFFLSSLFKRNLVELIISFSLSNLLLSIPIVFSYVFVFIYYLLSNLRVNKFSFSFVNLENKDNDNVIDTYLDEITYLFEQSKCKYVIFEDLDRGNNPEVFTHLRNLNFVLNNDIRCKDKNLCFWKRSQRRIVFIYLLRNDLLSPQEMVKFFDYTLSITPYAASSNIAFHALKIRDHICEYYKKLEEEKKCETDKTSEDKLETSQEIEDHDQTDKQNLNAQKSSEINIFKKSLLFTKEALDNDFIITVSRLVGDLRNIKQIFNDYQLLIDNFEFLFDDAKIIGKKIFSISVLKNYYPSGYNELISNKGKLYELLNREDVLCIDDVENKKSTSKTQSVIEENKFITDLDLCATTKINQLLNYLLTSNLLSKDYRFYVSKFSKKFCLDKNQYSFLRNVYDKNSIYEPYYEIISKNNELDILLSFLPDNTICSKAILNYHLFSFLLHNYINYQLVITNYISVILKGKYKQQGYIFLLELCTFLNEELKNKIKLNDQTKLNILTYLFIKSNDNIKDVINNLENPVQKSEFLLFILVYGIQQNLSNIINSNNNFFNGFNSLVNVKAYSTYILKGLNNIPQKYWIYLFGSLRYLYVELDYAPTSKILGGNLKEFYYLLDQWLTLNDRSKNKSSKYYLPFKINCENCSALANFLTSFFKEFTKNTDSQDLNCSNSFWSVLFDFKSEDEPSFLNIRKTIFNYIFEQNQFTEKNRYLRLLSVSSVIDKFNNLSKDESVTYLEDDPSIVFSFLTIITSLENEKKLKFSRDVNEDIVINVNDEKTYTNSRNEFYSLLQKYNSKSKDYTEENSIKDCFLDFENFCSNDFSELLDKTNSLLQRWHDCNLFESFPKDLNFELAKVVVISDFLKYSYLNKVNQKTPRHRVAPSLKNVLFVRDYLMSFNLSDSITDSSHLISESISPINLRLRAYVWVKHRASI